MVLINLQSVLHSLGLVSSIRRPGLIAGSGQLGDGYDDGLTAGGGDVPIGSLRRPGSNPPRVALELALSGANLLLEPFASSLSANKVDQTTEAAPPQRFLTLLNTGDPSADATVVSVSNGTDPAFDNSLNADMSSVSPITAFTDSISTKSGCSVDPYEPGHVALEPFEPFDPSVALVYRYRQQQGVNLGSWFVQEQWMNPSLFTCAAGTQQAELDVAQGWGGVENAKQVLERHWDEWITEDDFAYLASIGINTVRLPIGFWSLGPDYCKGTVFEPVSDVYANAWPRVVRAINWAAKYGLGVLVDLHGAPGSQNGLAHGGTSDGQQNLFDSETNIQLTVNVLTYLTQQLVKVNNIVGIELLNEPSNVDSLPTFYTSVLDTLRQVSTEAAVFPFYINDAYDLPRFTDYLATRHDFVVLDHHSYFVFDQASQDASASDLTTSLKPGQGSLSDQYIATAKAGRQNLVIDEWSCALSSQSLANSSSPEKERRQFCSGQMESYTNATAGWSFWSYKTENCDGDENWCFRYAVGRSLPGTFFTYPNGSLDALDLGNSAPPDLPSDQAFFSYGATMPFGSGIDTSRTDQWLAVAGSQNHLAQINEAFAAVPEGQSPSSERQSPAIKRSFDYLDMGERAFLLSSVLQRHRFAARHHRKRSRRNILHGVWRRQESEESTETTPEQEAISRGYKDGWNAAYVFAALNGSRLALPTLPGFTGQFMADALVSMDGQIVRGDEEHYKSWFLKGLADGEVQVMRRLAAT